ncbi:MAG TPA: hypothetical protein PLF13_06130 [candidate division Zixibacteria bacterium]|nr:hypothetical protein [candidate division Zixibacteria bacterium]
MLTRKIGLVLAIVTLLIGVVWVGCSDKSGTVSSGGQVTSTGIAAYFPVDPGYTTIYEVDYSNGTTQLVTYKATSETVIQGLTVHRLIQYVNGSVVDTGYIRTTSDAVFHFSRKTSSAEKMLELPFTLGASWDKDVFNQDELTDSVQVNDGNLGKTENDTVSIEDDGQTDVDPQLVSFPITGSTTMTVAGFESLELDNGEFYSHALKIVSTGHTGKTNYYWYVPGIGLAKYVIGASSISSLEGETVGQLVSHGF